MRLARLVMGLGLLLQAVRGAAASADDAFPCSVFIARDRCPVRSGPGDGHYVTDHARRGDVVEVFQRVPGGWLAIRPLPASFSWVAERDLTPTAVSDVASVVGDAAVSWIGSNVEEVGDHAWLVKLEAGEPVSVLGRERRKLLATGRSDVYCRISPPSGEFRWVHEDDVVESADQLAASDPEIELADFRVSLQGSPREGASPAVSEPPGPVRQEASTSAPAKRDDFIGRGTPRRKSAEPAPARPGEPAPARRAEPAPRTARLAPPATLPVPPLSSVPLEAAIRELDANLSLAVAQPVERWDFAALRREADQLAARASSTLERARVQIFLDKVNDFESLKSRHALLAPAAPPPSARLAPPAATLPPETAKGDSGRGNDVDPRFDGTGWLLPVHSTKRSAPPYALLDKEGNILQFVSPAPGLNLNRYLRREIGVFGQKEQRSTAEKPHLTAHRVVELDRHRPRR